MHALIPTPALAFSRQSASPFSKTTNNQQSGDHSILSESGLLGFVRKHHRPIFHLTHSLIRDEVTAERITQQVFTRARRHLGNGESTAAVTAWLYYASLRFARQWYWNSNRQLARRRIATCIANNELGMDLKTFVRVIVHCQSKIEPHDCELLALRHVLGMPLANIAQLLRMHPYEVSNRLVWARERISNLNRQMPEPDTVAPIALPMSA